MNASTNNPLCTLCAGTTSKGDIRSGILSFGAFFTFWETSKNQLKRRPKAGMSYNRVVSFACNNCGHISNYLADKIACESQAS